MDHNALIQYLNEGCAESEFPASLGRSGGYINFKNSGRRGAVKEFTLSLESVISGLTDILNNIDVFRGLSRYSETPWRDNGSNYFLDVALKSMVTVQTKPVFSMFSMILP